MDAQSLIDALALIENLQRQTCSEAGPGWSILLHIKRRLDSDLRQWLLGHA